MLEDLDIMRYWCEDNPEQLDDFQKAFINKFNILAARTKIPRIN